MMTVDVSVVDYRHGRLRCPTCRRMVSVLGVLSDGRLLCSRCVRALFTER